MTKEDEDYDLYCEYLGSVEWVEYNINRMVEVLSNDSISPSTVDYWLNNHIPEVLKEIALLQKNPRKDFESRVKEQKKTVKQLKKEFENHEHQDQKTQ